MTAAQVAPEWGISTACEALGLGRATLYRHLAPQKPRPQIPSPLPHHRALDPGERQAVLDLLHQERFVDKAPRVVHATLLDEGKYLCPPSTMYRLLNQAGEVKERRNQLRHPPYRKPELLATGPNQVWSWDITKLLGPVKWTYFYL